MPDPTAEPSQRDKIARALAEKFTPDYQRNPKFDRKREQAWFDAGNPDEEPANSQYMPLPMAERVRLDLMVTSTDYEGERFIRPVRIPEVVEVVAAVRDAEMEQLRADFQAVDESNLADTQAVANENQRLRAELAELRERAVVLPDDWRRQLANEVSDVWLSRIVALVESWFPAPEPEDIADEVNGR